MKKKWIIIRVIILIFLVISMCVIIVLVQKEERKVTSFEVTNNIIQYTANPDGLYALTTNGEMICYPTHGTASYKLDITDVIYCDMLHHIIKKNGDIYNDVTETEAGDYIGTIPSAISCSKFEDIIAVLTDTGELYVRYFDLEDVYKVKFNHTDPYGDWVKINDFGEVKKVLIVDYEIYVLNMQDEYYYCSYSAMPEKIETESSIKDIFANHDGGSFFLDIEGNLYQRGSSFINNQPSSSNYEKVSHFQKIKRVKIELYQGLALSRQNTLYIWARDVKKIGMGSHVAYIYDEIENFVYDDFFLGGDYIYALKGTTMTRIPFPTEKQ